MNPGIEQALAAWAEPLIQALDSGSYDDVVCRAGSDAAELPPDQVCVIWTVEGDLPDPAPLHLVDCSYKVRTPADVSTLDEEDHALIFRKVAEIFTDGNKAALDTLLGTKAARSFGDWWLGDSDEEDEDYAWVAVREFRISTAEE